MALIDLPCGGDVEVLLVVVADVDDGGVTEFRLTLAGAFQTPRVVSIAV